MKYFLILTLFALVGCTQEEEPKSPIDFKAETESGDPFEGLSMKDAVELHIRRELSISVDEPIDYQIYEANCDGDANLDAVITVNLLDRAIDAAIKSGMVAKKAEIGFMGNFNYIIYRDGFSGEFSSAMAIPSSPKAKLKITFEHIRSEKQKDILVDYRILNAGYRNFFTITNGHPVRINQVKLFDGIGTKDAIVYALEYETGLISTSKDIVVYEGTFTNPTFTSPDDVYLFEPQISKTQHVHERWFFNPKDRKYYMKKE
ncbi:MAG: hypothetical protein HRT58_20985 [Crocinitomicaceae bacterium]|nr:hypothetical protein [Flavobacteriales bacterium]NQZ38147.1 hypothetical protein [Crocinitomicaceae bacterium]